MKTRILLVDDHQIVRQGLRLIIESQSNMEVIGEASDGLEGLEMAQQLSPDLVILDLNMPKMNGFETARAIRQTLIEPRILILTQHDVSQMRIDSTASGANGFLSKSEAALNLFEAIKALMSGQAYFPEDADQLRAVRAK